MNSSIVLPEGLIDSDNDNPRIEREDGLVVERFAIANLPTKFGQFRIASFKNNRDGKDHVAVFKDLDRSKPMLARIHSECVTGDVFGSLKCDCGEQLELAMHEIAEDGGLLLYMRQEGRGIGLANKVKAYSLQDQGFDTVEANLHLGFDDDMREYDIAAAMLQLLDIESIELMTNNPKKVAGLRENGIEVLERVPLRVLPNPYNVHYLDTKKKKSGHML
jgi:GTP cyclohydrolase II